MEAEQDILILLDDYREKMPAVIIEKLLKAKVIYLSPKSFYSLPLRLFFFGRVPAYFSHAQIVY